MNLEVRLLGIPADRSRAFPPALARLNDYVGQPEISDYAHSLEITPSGVKLKIGILQRDQKKFMSLVLRAIQEGSLSEIDTGSVVGPKVFIMLNHFVSDAAKRRVNLEIHGEFSGWVMSEAQQEQAHGLLSNYDPLNPTDWTESEVREFEAAVKDLGLEKCKGSSSCKFQVMIRNGQATIEIFENKQFR